jgi:hypothetical protein
MQTIKLNTTNPETLELIISQIKEIESLDFTVQTITLQDIDDPELPYGGSKWYWEIKSKTPINPEDNAGLASIIDPDNAGDISFKHDKKTNTYKFTLEVY